MFDTGLAGVLTVVVRGTLRSFARAISTTTLGGASSSYTVKVGLRDPRIVIVGLLRGARHGDRRNSVKVSAHFSGVRT